MNLGQFPASSVEEVNEFLDGALVTIEESFHNEIEQMHVRVCCPKVMEKWCRNFALLHTINLML
jgi:hypothetical protein